MDWLRFAGGGPADYGDHFRSQRRLELALISWERQVVPSSCEDDWRQPMNDRQAAKADTLKAATVER